MYVVAQANYQLKFNVMENKFDKMICFRMGKMYMAKTPLGDFKVTTLENPLLSEQAITSKGIPVPYTNLQLNPYLIPNWTISPFDA